MGSRFSVMFPCQVVDFQRHMSCSFFMLNGVEEKGDGSNC